LSGGGGGRNFKIESREGEQTQNSHQWGKGKRQSGGKRVSTNLETVLKNVVVSSEEGGRCKENGDWKKKKGGQAVFREIKTGGSKGGGVLRGRLLRGLGGKKKAKGENAANSCQKEKGSTIQGKKAFLGTFWKTKKEGRGGIVPQWLEFLGGGLGGGHSRSEARGGKKGFKKTHNEKMIVLVRAWEKRGGGQKSSGQTGFQSGRENKTKKKFKITISWQRKILWCGERGHRTEFRDNLNCGGGGG